MHKIDRKALALRSLKERPNKVSIERDRVLPMDPPGPLSDVALRVIDETADRLKRARDAGKSRMLAFGAHAIKNGLAPVIIALIEEDWFTHLATNGAGIIHDWEFAFQGASSEDVRGGIPRGEFGLWEETGRYLNLALAVGAYAGRGYGEAVGEMVEREGIHVPGATTLRNEVVEHINDDPARAAAAADLLSVVSGHDLEEGWLSIDHPFKQYGLQAAAYRLDVPFTSHPMIGHDNIYFHPLNCCAALGRCAERDFLAFAHGVSRIDGGAYLSVGSSVMSPMIFEKAMSMAQNLAIQEGRRIENHFITVVDLAESRWDWEKGEPPENDPAYYLRYNKTFSRMGGAMRYAQANNRDFLLALGQALQAT